jgi:hypothetical protein
MALASLLQLPDVFEDKSVVLGVTMRLRGSQWPQTSSSELLEHRYPAIQFQGAI